jgi:hypothetical protein
LNQSTNSYSKELNQHVIDWLLEEEQPSVRYYTLVDILGREENDPEVREAHSRIVVASAQIA